MTVNMLSYLHNFAFEADELTELTGCLLWGLCLCIPLKQAACPLNVFWPEGILHVCNAMMGELRKTVFISVLVQYAGLQPLHKANNHPTCEDVAA